MGESCLFCRIASGEVPGEKVFEDDEVLAFKDINPQAPLHLLVIPKKHLTSIGETGPEDAALLGRTLLTCSQLAKDNGYADSGYRVVNNTGTEAGQTVHHIHFHLLAGRPLSWPPG